MDYQLLTRVQSHAVDLFNLGQEQEERQRKKHDEEEEQERQRRRKEREQQKRPGSPFARDEQPSPSIPKSKSVPLSLSTLAEEGEEEDEDEYEIPSLPSAVSPPRTATPVRARTPDVMVPARVKSPGVKKRKGEALFREWISMRRLSLEEQQKIHYEDLFGCFTRNFGKGFALGFGGKVLLNVFSELIHVLRNTRKANLSGFAHVGGGAKDHGLFFALLLATHNSIMYMSRDMNHANARYRGSVAGFIAGLVSLVYLPSSMKRSVVLFTFVRAFELGCKMLVLRKILPNLENGDTALMSLSSAFMIYTWLFHPKALDPSYVHFLQRQVQVPVPIVRAMADCQSGRPLENLEAVNAARLAMARKGTIVEVITDPLSYDSPRYSASEKAGIILHPNQTFFEFTRKYFLNGIRNAIPVYVPVYVVPLLLFSRTRLFRDPFNTLKSAAMGASRSTLFLATYCTFGIASLSVGRLVGFRHDVVGRFARLLPFFAGAFAGTATLIEKKQRRIELALYVMSKAVEGLHNILKEKLGERIASPPFGDELLFACSFSIICHANLRHPNLVRESYRALLMRFFDTDERHKFF